MPPLASRSSVSFGEPWFATTRPPTAPIVLVTAMQVARFVPRLTPPVDEQALASVATMIAVKRSADRRMPLLLR
jgi:hypothetical protein